MRAVAELLGVDRKALNYYVSDRGGLLELLAADAFSTEFARLDVTADPDWRVSLRAFARAVRQSLLRTGALVSYVRFEGAPTEPPTLRLTDDCLRVLMDAGLTPSDAGQTMYCLTHYASGVGRSEVLRARGGADLQFAETAKALESLTDSAHDLPALRKVMDLGNPVAGGADQAFERGLDLFLAGIEAGLTAR